MVYLPKKMVLSRCLLLSSVSKLAPKVISTTLSFSQEVACSADLQLHAPYWPEANKPHGNRLSHANREDGMCEDILVDKVVLGNKVLQCKKHRFGRFNPHERLKRAILGIVFRLQHIPD